MIRHRVRLVLALLAVLAVALVPASELGAQGKGTIKIATQSPLSGGQAALGEGIKLGAQLAVEKFKGTSESRVQGRARAVRRSGQARRRRGQRQEHHRRQGHPRRDRPPQLRRRHPVLRGLQGSQPRDDLAGEHQREDHRPRLPERQPRLRPRRRPGTGRRRVRRQHVEGEVRLHRPRQDHLRSGRRRGLQGRGARRRASRSSASRAPRRSRTSTRSSRRSRPRTPT